MSKMLTHRHHKPEPETKATFPTIKLKNITCVYCSSQFILKNLNDLRRSPVPLLLACGHPFCGQCLKRHEREPCPLCTPTAESSMASKASHPPANTYLVGLIALRQPSPTYGREPDITFPQKASSKSKLDGSKEDHCNKCGYRAILRCLDCKALFCQKCYQNDHAQLQVAEKHQTIVLQTCEDNSVFEEKKCTTHDGIMDYYCETCSFPSCHHCMLLDHKNHDIVPLATKNQEYVVKFHDVQNKIGDTIQRIYQAKKKIQKMLIFPEELQKNETIENAINKHFVHLHGVLQNIEKRAIDRLHEQRDSLATNLEVLQQRLNVQESHLQSALTMALTRNDLMTRMNLKDIVSKMEKLAVETQCFLVQDPILSPDNIIFQPDLSIITALENHCQLDIPKISNYCLHREDSLPKDYKVEPLAVKSDVSIDTSICSEPSTIKNALSCQSLNFERSETQPEQNGGSLIPVKISYVENPSNFYVYRVSNLASIAQLQERLDNYASHNDEEPSEILQNSFYAVKSTESGQWYRGRVTAINSSPEGSETYEIFDLDRGSIERGVTKKQMRSIFEPITKIPPMVMQCIMFEIFPRNGAWSDEARKTISQYQESNETLLMYIKLSKGNTYYVDLVRDNSKRILGSSTSSIRDVLIWQGLGVPTTSFQLLRKSPNAVQRMYVEDLALQSYHEVEVSYAESPDCIYVRKPKDGLLYLQNMMAEMNKFYNDKVKSDYGIIYVPEIGITCAAQDANGQWHRAMISNGPTKARMVTVTLFDVGRQITVSFDNIRTLHGKFMTGTAQAIKTSLADIKPVDGEWSDDCLAVMTEHLKVPEVEVFSYEKTGDTFTVSLTTSIGINMAALLIAKGFAIATGPRSSGAVEATLAPPKKKSGASKARNSRTMRRRKAKQAALKKELNPCVKKIDDPFKLRVEILRVVSPDEIFVADPESEKAYKKLVTNMQRFYGRYEQHSNDGEWKVGDQCAVYSASDKSFCRGKIIGFKDPDEAQVFLYDLTYTENIPVSELQILKNDFWNTPIHAVKVKLAGVRPCGGSSNWLSVSCQALKDLITGNQNGKFYICKVDNPESEDLEVELWIEQNTIEGPLEAPKIKINSIKKLFVESGLALPIKQHGRKPNILAAELQRQISNANEQDISMRKNKIMNGTFRKKEHSDDTVVSQEIDTDDDSYLSDQNDSSFAGYDDPTMLSGKDSTLNGSDNETSEEKPEQTATEWLAAEPIVEDQFMAMVTNLDHDCRLYLHSIRQSRATLHYIEKTLAEICNRMKVTPRDLVWEKGDLCIAQYHSDKKWYRGQVHRVLENEMIEVEFIDYGNFEECENGTLRKSLALLNIPRQGARCKIDGLVPNTSDGKWMTIDLDRIHGVIVDQECDINVLKRKPDHLVVSLIMMHPRRCDIKKFLRNDLKLNIGTNSENSESSSDEATETSEDVVIDGYIEDDDVIDLSIGEDTRLEIQKEKNSDELIDHSNEDILEKSNEIEDNDSKVTIIGHSSDSEPADNGKPTASPVQEDILSGTICFTPCFDGIDVNLQENNLDALDSISLPDELNGFREDEFTVSTPYEESFEVYNNRINPVTIPDDVTLVEAEIAVIGVNSFLLQLFGNNSSKILTHQRRLYEKMMADMQAHAESQPVLKPLKRGELCCAKYSDGQWYRSKVQSNESQPYELGHTIKVYFIDFGNEYCVKSEDIRALREEWFEAPNMLIHCSLLNVFASSDDSETAREICEFFDSQRYTKSRKLRTFYIKIENRVDDVYQIQMYNDASCTNLTYQPIIDKGLYLVTTDL